MRDVALKGLSPLYDARVSPDLVMSRGRVRCGMSATAIIAILRLEPF
jgi:hypothetical protein